jgi:hypothetical protein
MHLKENKIPKGLIPLERLFYRDDKAKDYQEGSKPKDCIEIKIGIDWLPKIISIGKNFIVDERREI